MIDNNIKKQEEMCKFTGIDEFINTLLNKYDTIIDDEAMTSLDNDKIQNVINVLNELKKNHTVIVITHKKEIEDIVDDVIAIDHGKIKIS